MTTRKKRPPLKARQPRERRAAFVQFAKRLMQRLRTRRLLNKVQKQAFVPVQSSNLHSILYNPKEKRLKVAFRSAVKQDRPGSIYEYRGVPEKAYKKLLHAKSKGQTFNAIIKDKYQWERVDG